MPEILFAVESAESRSLPLNAQRLVNLFTEKQDRGAKSQTPLFAAPGMSAFANTAAVVGGIAALGSITGGSGYVPSSSGVATLGTIIAGSGYTAGTYTGVPLTGGAGSGAQGTIIVGSSSGVSSVALTAPGTGYLVGDSLSALAAALGGSGLITVLGAITHGSSYTNGVYTGVPLTGGSGTGAKANITVSGGVVSAVALSVPGYNYVIGDTLSAAASTIGGTGSGFSIPVTNTEVTGTGFGVPVATLNTYNNVPLTGGSGTGAKANITVNGSGVVSVVVLTAPGVNYIVGDVLSAAASSLGGSGSGFSIPVSALSISGDIRGSWVKQDVPYVVSGQTLYQLSLASSGIYVGVPLTGGFGGGALANITITSGVVTHVSLTSGGANYQIGDVLSAPLGGGSGFQISVATLSGTAIATLGAITGGQNYQVGISTIVGTGITGTDIVSMSDNGFQLGIVSGDVQQGWVLDTNPASATYGFQNITAAWTAAGVGPANTITFFDGYFVFDRIGTNEFFLSGLYDGTTYNGLDFASAESQPDFVTGTIQNLQLLFVICQAHLELWYDAGGANFPFQRYTGAGISYGCLSPQTIIRQDGAVFFLGSDKTFYRLQSTIPIRVSTHPVEHIIDQDPDITKASCFTYTLEGHKFVVLQLNASNRTLVFDISTNKWHERESWNNTNQSLGRWRASTAFRAFNGVYYGDAFNGNVNLLDWTVYTELGNTIRGLAYSVPYHQDRKRLFISRFELDIQAGVGLPSGYGSDPQIMLGWSVDGAQSFKTLQFWRSMGKIGDYLQRLRWLRMGNGRQFVFMISITDPVPRVIISAHADISIGM